jgi:excisionase family DNA binding protein
MTTETSHPLGFALEVPDAVLDAIAERVAEKIRPRWREIKGVADYLGVTVRRVRELRERGLPAKKIGRRLVFDLRAVDAWEREG